MNLAQLIVQDLEFSGYGPAYSPDAKTVKVHWHDRIHTFSLDPQGRVLDIPAPSLGVNPLPPDYLATLAVLNHLTSTYKDEPPLNNMVVSKFTNHLIVNSRFMWMVEPEKHKQLVLHTMLVKGVPVWTHPEFVPYNQSRYTGLYSALYQLFSKVRDNDAAKKAAGISPTLLDNLVEWAYTKSGQGAP